jgi:hypothetical protein
VFTARYGLSPYIKQIRFVFKRLMIKWLHVSAISETSSGQSCSNDQLHLNKTGLWMAHCKPKHVATLSLIIVVFGAALFNTIVVNTAGWKI